MGKRNLHTMTLFPPGEDVTIFAPTDDAFEKMTVGQANDLSSDPEVARKTVLGHILDKFMCCAGIHRRGPFLDDSNKRMMTGEPRVIRRSRGDRSADALSH